jgi:SHS2 domain-containing protein
LNELLYLLDTRSLLPRRIRVIHLNETSLTAEIAGETVDPRKHRVRRMVKAATYHGLRLAQEDALWEARVILDL